MGQALNTLVQAEGTSSWTSQLDLGRSWQIISAIDCGLPDGLATSVLGVGGVGEGGLGVGGGGTGVGAGGRGVGALDHPGISSRVTTRSLL